MGKQKVMAKKMNLPNKNQLNCLIVLLPDMGPALRRRPPHLSRAEEEATEQQPEGQRLADDQTYDGTLEKKFKNDVNLAFPSGV